MGSQEGKAQFCAVLGSLRLASMETGFSEIQKPRALDCSQSYQEFREAGPLQKFLSSPQPTLVVLEASTFFV